MGVKGKIKRLAKDFDGIRWGQPPFPVKYIM